MTLNRLGQPFESDCSIVVCVMVRLCVSSLPGAHSNPVNSM